MLLRAIVGQYRADCLIMGEDEAGRLWALKAIRDQTGRAGETITVWDAITVDKEAEELRVWLNDKGFADSDIRQSSNVYDLIEEGRRKEDPG